MGNSFPNARNDSSKPSSFNSPILRLDGSCWSFIAPFLDYNDLIRLIHAGTHALSSRVRHVHGVRLRWTSTRYIDFDEVISTLNPFGSLYEVDFIGQTLHWAPLPTDLLPSSLIALKLDFPSVITSLMSQSALRSILPSLEILQLSEKSPQFATEVPQEPPIQFRGLPPFLRTLSINSPKTFYMAVEQFEELPTSLETLSLLFNPVILPEQFLESKFATSNAFLQFTLKLPELNSLTSLAVQSDGHSLWHVDCALLPPSLTKFKYRSAKGTHSTKANDYGCSINMTDLSFRLRHLKELNLRSFEISPETLVELVPPSVTRLKVIVTSDARELPLSTSEFLAQRIVSIRAGRALKFEELILSGTVAAPRLERFYDTLYKFPVEFPDSIKKITMLSNTIERVPANLEELSITWSYIARNNFAPFGNRLRKLELFTNIISTDLELDSLPDTLESLNCGFTSVSWFKLLNRMFKPHRFQKLSELISTFALDILSLEQLPTQLKKLTFKIHQDSLQRPLNSATLNGLKSSSLTSLNIAIGEYYSATMLDSTLQIINHFPCNLIELWLLSPCPVSAQWPVSLPSNLVYFYFQQTHSDLDDARGSDESNGTFILPASLAYLHIIYCNVPWKWEQLPPRLSVMVGDAYLAIQYFENRTPPSDKPNYELCAPKMYI